MAKLTDTAVRFFDGMRNVLTGLNTSSDSHAAGAHWFHRPISQPEIDAAFRTSWLVRKIHVIPTTDQVRPWRSWKAKPEQITAIEKEERRLGLRSKVRRALLFSKLYGGAAIVMGVLGDDPSEPLDVDRVKQSGLSYLHVLTRYELNVTAIDMDPGSPRYGEPVAYIANGGGNQAVLHPSRVVRFTNGDLPDTIAFSEQGWSDPLLTNVRDAIANADAAQGNFAALTSKALTSTLSTPGLLELVSTAEGERKFIEKTRVMQAFRSMFNLNIVAGAKNSNEVGETLTDTTFSFANVPEMGSWFVQLVAGAADVPMTRLMGTSPNGMSATGESDTANYWTMLDAGRELDLRPCMEMIDEVLIRSALGNRPPEIWFEWSPFEVDTETVRAGNAKLRSEAVKTLSESGTVPSEVLAKAVRGLLIDGGEYPGIEDAYSEYESAGNVLGIEEPEPAANDNGVLSSAIEGLSAQGKSASVAAKDARMMLADARPMTLYISRKVENFAAIRAHFEAQGVKVTVPDDKAHVTICHSSTPIDWMTVSPDDYRDPVLKLPEGGARIMEKFGVDGGTLVQLFSSSQLSWRHEEILRAGATWDWPSFEPHYSLDYDAAGVSVDGIKPWLGEIVLGPERFETINDDWNSNEE